jgi:ankyrin repeat protein
VKKTLTIIALVVLALFLFFVAPPIYHFHQIHNLDSMIQAGDAAGVSQLITAHPQLMEADLDPISREKITPLAVAAGIGQETICSNLIASGANVNAQDIVGQTPLHRALMSGLNTDIVPMLLQHGADITVKNKDGWTPLFNAVFSDNTNTVLMLLQRGADATLKDRFGDSLLDLAKKSKVNDYIIEMLSKAISQTTNQIILK